MCRFIDEISTNLIYIKRGLIRRETDKKKKVVHSTTLIWLNQPLHRLFSKFFFSTHDNHSTNLYSFSLLDFHIELGFSFVDIVLKFSANEKLLVFDFFI